MIEEKVILHPQFSVLLRDNFAFDAAENSTVGEITFGAIDRMAYTGNITWAALAGSDKYWSVKMGNCIFGNQKLEIQSNFAVLNTGASGIILPDEEADAINMMIGTKKWLISPLELVQCERRASLPDLHIDIGGRYFTLTPKDYIVNIPQSDMCQSVFTRLPQFENSSKINATSSLFDKSWVLGIPFLKKYFSVYDLGKKRVGLATAGLPSMADYKSRVDQI